MRRRAFLVSALTATSTIIAGCNSGDSRIEHTDPTVESDDQDDAKYLEFRGDGAELATVGVDPDLNPTPSALFVSISHPEDTRLESLTQRFAAPDGDGTPPELSLRASDEGDDIPHPPVTLSQDGEAAVAKVDGFGDFADETAFIPLAVTRWPESAHRLVVESTVVMGADDNTHVLDGQFEFEFAAETEADDRTTDTPDSSG
jgi:hypothetical protein